MELGSLSNVGIGMLGKQGAISAPGTKEVGNGIVQSLCKNIRKNLSGEEWTCYEVQKKDKSRIQLFSNRKEIQSCVRKNLELYSSQKDKAKAMILKTEGNKSFGSGDNQKALYLYTRCLAWMPHEDSKDVAIVYANRSAALFHLGEFSFSMKDAELAFSLNYPSELHYKLHERMGRCFMELGDNWEADKKFKLAIKSLELSGMDETKIKKTKKLLQELVKSSSTASHGFFQNRDKSSSGNTGHQESIESLPDLAGGRNKYLRAASSKLTLQYREKQGRFVTANEGFLPGDVVLVEKAYVSTLNPECYHRQCFQCYSPLLAPIVCENCIYASFCSKKCQEAARIHHQYECSILGLLKNSGISVICYMALRILTQTNAKTALSWYEMVDKAEDAEVSAEKSNNCQDKVKTPETLLGFNEEYRTDHVALFHLVTHSQARRKEDLFHQIIMSLYLLRVLKTTNYFKCLQNTGASGGPSKGEGQDKNGNASSDEVKKTSICEDEKRCEVEKVGDSVLSELEIKFATVILRSLQALQFNAHETSGWDSNRSKDHSVGFGAGLFPTLSLFNHSCNPAIVRYFINDTVVVRAIRTILPGEAVNENYGQNYSLHQKPERQAELHDHFWFDCECVACREDWPRFEDMTGEMTMKFRCSVCRTFICKADESMGILFKCGKCGNNVNVLKSLKAIHESDTQYHKAVDFIENGQVETGLGIILENLALLEKYLVPPFREYHLCQEYMRRCYLSFGNRVSTLPVWNPENIDCN